MKKKSFNAFSHALRSALLLFNAFPSFYDGLQCHANTQNTNTHYLVTFQLDLVSSYYHASHSLVLFAIATSLHPALLALLYLTIIPSLLKDTT